jgi:hypothetical protein
MAGVAQLVRASGCGSEGRRFDPGHSPHPRIHSERFIQVIPHILALKLLSCKMVRGGLLYIVCMMLWQQVRLLEVINNI